MRSGIQREMFAEGALFEEAAFHKALRSIFALDPGSPSAVATVGRESVRPWPDASRMVTERAPS